MVGSAPGSGLDHDAAAAGGLDALACGGAERVRVHREPLREFAVREHLDRDPLASAEARGTHRLERDDGTGLEARLEVDEVDRLGVRAERLERHRLLLVRAAQLAHPHVDRHLAALEAGAILGAGARAVALLPAARGLAGARALAATDALAGAPAAGRRPQRMQPDPLLGGPVGG